MTRLFCRSRYGEGARQVLLATVSFAFVTLAAWADTPPTSDWVPDETVVVSAPAAGPAFWHIKKADSDVYILGKLSALPQDFAWNSAHAGDLIKGARVVLTPAKGSAGFLSMTWFVLWHHSLLSIPDDRKLPQAISPALWRRFANLVHGLHGPAPESFADDAPIIAAVKLEGDYVTTAKLTGEEPEATMVKLARQNRVPVSEVAEYDMIGLVKEILRLPLDKQEACLDEAVSDVEQRLDHARPAAEAWANGDVKAIKAHYTPRVFWQCARATESFGKLYDRSVADYTAAINDALSKPGKTILIMDIGALLRNTGVVEKLHAEGLTIEGPAE